MTNKNLIISLIILAATLCAVKAVSKRSVPVVVRTNLEQIPMEIAGFTATEDSFSQAIYDELNADAHVYRHYRSADGRWVDLYIGYYGTAKGGRTPHNPYACFPSSGWTIIEAKTESLDPEDDRNYSAEVPVNYMLVNNGESYNVVLHWYQSDGNKVLATGIQKNIQRFIGRTMKNKNDGAFVRVSAIADEENIDKVKDMVSFFSKQILTILPSYWPEERSP